MKGFFVCGQDYRDITIRSREEVRQAVNKLKAKHPRELLSVEGFYFVVYMVCIESAIISADDDYGLNWVQDEEDEPGADISYMTTTDAGCTEQRLATSAFLRGR